MGQSSQSSRARNSMRQHFGLFLPLSLMLLLRCSRTLAFLATPTSTAMLQGHQSSGEFRSIFLTANNENDAEGSRGEETRETSVLATGPPKEAETTTTNVTPPPVTPSAKIEQEQRRRQQQPPPVRAQDIMLALNTSPRRLFLGTLSATGIALAGNFLGVTSQLLTLVPESAVESTGLDTYFPRGTNYDWCLLRACHGCDYYSIFSPLWDCSSIIALTTTMH